MSVFSQGVFLGISGVLTLDTIGSILAQRLKFWYGRLAPLSIVIWAAAGAFAAQKENEIVLIFILGAATGFTVGLIDSTLGWWISWRLGAAHIRSDGQFRATAISTKIISKVIVRVTLKAMFCGVLGAFLLKLVN
jgi:hypothetical protein